MRKPLILAAAAAAAGLLAAAGGALASGMGHSGMGHSGMGGPGMGGPGMGGGRMMQDFDSDQDGSFTQEDVDKARAERFARFDANGDGVLDLDEYQALWLDAMRERMVRGFQLHDRDGDAMVTLEEFQATTGDLVARRDRNGDGEITRDEMQRRQHGKGRHDGPQGRPAPMRGGQPN